MLFNRKKFEAMMLERGVTKEDVAHYLGISVASYYRRIRDNGNFTANEIRMLINFFGKDKVLACIFYDE